MSYKIKENDSNHLVKNEANKFVFSLYETYLAVKKALSMPSISGNCTAQCAKMGIFDDNTKHIIIENGQLSFENKKSISYDFFHDKITDLMNNIFSDEKIFEERGKIYWGTLGDCATNVGAKEKRNSIEWGNYDTCSYPYFIDRWLPYHLTAYKIGAPIILTLDADYSNRMWAKNKNSILFKDTSNRRDVLKKWFGMDNINKTCKEELLKIVEDVKMKGLINYFTSIGIDVDFAGCYKESISKDSSGTKLMMVFSGKKKFDLKF